MPARGSRGVGFTPAGLRSDSFLPWRFHNETNLRRSDMSRLSVFAFLLSLVVGIAGCSKEEPEGPAEKMGKQIDEAAETMKEETVEAAEATQEQAAEAKAALGEAMEETGKEMQ
jgi:hypothetical protein